jgi:hypothetical protein
MRDTGMREGPTLVLCLNGLPSADAWTSELQAAGLDILVHPVHPIHADWMVAPMSVHGHLAILSFNGLASLAKCQWWFPVAVPTAYTVETVHARVDGIYKVERERVATWAAVGSLTGLSSAVVFDRESARPYLAEIAYDIAREMIVSLAPKPHQMPGAPNLDFRTHSARRYDDGDDVEGGDVEAAQRLEKAATESVQERRQRAGAQDESRAR